MKGYKSFGTPHAMHRTYIGCMTYAVDKHPVLAVIAVIAICAVIGVMLGLMMTTPAAW